MKSIHISLILLALAVTPAALAHQDHVSEAHPADARSEAAPLEAEALVVLDVVGEPMLVLDEDPAPEWRGLEARVVDLPGPLLRVASVTEGALPERITRVRDQRFSLMIDGQSLCEVRVEGFAMVDRVWAWAEEGEAFGDVALTLVATLTEVPPECEGATWALPAVHHAEVVAAEPVESLELEEAVARRFQGHLDHHPEMAVTITLLEQPESGQRLAWARGALETDACAGGLWAELGVLYAVEETRDGVELRVLHEGLAYDLVDAFDADADGALELLFDHDALGVGAPSTALIRSSDGYAEPAWSRITVSGCGC